MDIPTQRIVGIECSNGKVYTSEDYDIQPFSNASFIVKRRGVESRFVIIPSRVVELIEMEIVDNGNQATAG